MKTYYNYQKSGVDRVNRIVDEADFNGRHHFIATIFTVSLILLMSFNSFSQTITVLSPNGGEVWMSGTTQTISWQLDGSDYEDLLIEYSIDDGAYWYYIGYVSSFDSLDQITITNYLMPSDSAIVKISLYRNPSISDVSDNYFTTLENPVYFYTPYAGSNYYNNADVQLSYFSATIDTFNVDYTTDGGNTWVNIESFTTETEITWTTPNELSNNCMIRVQNAMDTTVYGLSGTFSLVELPSATIISPNGGEVWNYGETATISWSGTNLPYYVYFEYSDDGGQSWDYLTYGYGDETGGTTTVNVPYNSTTNALVRIFESNYSVPLDESDQEFTIYVPPVIVYNPYEGSEFYINDETWLSWLATDIDEVNIELSTNGGANWSIIEQNVDADYGWYTWNISGSPSTNCYIRISDASDPSKFGLSSQFTLLETPVITLNSPIGSDIWNTDTEYDITWTYDNPNSYYVYIDFSIDNGNTWYYIGYASKEDSLGSYTWKTPPVESDSCLIRVTDSYLDFVSDTSEMFSIRSFPTTPICIVSVDSATNNNIIVWEKPINALINDFILYKESDVMNVYEAIGTVSYLDEPVFVDTNSNPAIKSYRYKLGFSDADNNIYPMGPFHQTIHLTINKGVGDSWNLIWTDYVGFDVSQYNIYRSSNGGSYEMISSISSSFSSFTDLNAPTGSVYYYVEVINQAGCDNTGRGLSSSISNIATNNVLGTNEHIRERFASIYPNPADNSANINLENFKGITNIYVMDIAGNIVFKDEIVSNMEKTETTVDVKSLIPGLYIVKINGSDFALTRKLIVK